MCEFTMMALPGSQAGWLILVTKKKNETLKEIPSGHLTQITVERSA
jgi:hypothetical protein